MAEEGVHPGSWVGDSVEEFKKLPIWGKVGVGAAGLIAVYLGYRAYASSKSSTPAGNPTGASPSGASMLGGTQSPFPTVNGLPLLPPGINPIYNPTTGDTVGYQGNPIVNPSGPVSTSPSPSPTNAGPLIPYGSYKGPSYSNLKPNTHYTYNGTDYTLKTGAQGRLWGINPQGQQVLLYAPQSQYPTGQGSGGPTTASYMSNPDHYHQSAEPHLPSSVPQVR